MALKRCRECRKMVSDQAAACPHCGVPNPVPPPSRRQEGGSNGTTKAVVGILAFMLFVVVVNAIATDDSSGGTTSKAIATAERADSLRFFAVAANPDTAAPATLAEADEYFHVDHFADHPQLHRAFIESRMDSVRKYVGVKEGNQTALARRAVIMRGVDTAYTPADLALVRRVRREMDAFVKAATARALKEQKAAAAVARRDYATRLEVEYLKQGKDIKVSATGTDATRLNIEWVLVSRPLVFNFQNDASVIGALRNLGFKSVRMTDGFDETWTFDL